jgi:hypothetical protein
MLPLEASTRTRIETLNSIIFLLQDQFEHHIRWTTFSHWSPFRSAASCPNDDFTRKRPHYSRSLSDFSLSFFTTHYKTILWAQITDLSRRTIRHLIITVHSRDVPQPLFDIKPHFEILPRFSLSLNVTGFRFGKLINENERHV